MKVYIAQYNGKKYVHQLFDGKKDMQKSDQSP